MPPITPAMKMYSTYADHVVTGEQECEQDSRDHRQDQVRRS